MVNDNDNIDTAADNNGIVFEYDAIGSGVRAKHLATGLQEYNETHSDAEDNKYIAYGNLLEAIGLRSNAQQILNLPTPTEIDAVAFAQLGVNGSSEVDVPANEVNVPAASDTSGAVAASNDDSVPNVTNEDGHTGDITVAPNSDDPDAAAQGVDESDDSKGQGGNEDASAVGDVAGVTAPVEQYEPEPTIDDTASTPADTTEVVDVASSPVAQATDGVSTAPVEQESQNAETETDADANVPAAAGTGEGAASESDELSDEDKVDLVEPASVEPATDVENTAEGESNAEQVGTENVPADQAGVTPVGTPSNGTTDEAEQTASGNIISTDPVDEAPATTDTADNSDETETPVNFTEDEQSK